MDLHHGKAVPAIFTALLLGFALACAGSPAPEPAQEVAPRSDFDPGLDDPASLSGSEIGEGERVAALEPVYFDYDRAMIREDQKPTLRSNSSAIGTANTWRAVVVEGHCDERGSEEYNLALGERRANAVKQYLANLGVGASKLDTVSFGESKPAVQGHDESAWRWNRRAEFRVVR